jgi:hypothetical protein
MQSNLSWYGFESPQRESMMIAFFGGNFKLLIDISKT